MTPRPVELAREFTRLGLTAFGGPAAHLAIMQRELVERRAWLSQQRFVDLIGLSSVLPGPSSTEVALGIGYERGRWPGLLVAALGFIGPAVLITLVIAVIYVEAGTLGEARHLLYGMSPVVIAVVAHAMIVLLPSAFTDAVTWVVGLGAFVASLVLEQPLLVLIGAALVTLVLRRGPAWLRGGGSSALLGGLALGEASPSSSAIVPGATAAGAVAAVAGAATTLGGAGIFLTFLKIGLVVFGSGYVLLAFLGTELVVPGYVTDQEILDAVAIGQLTPGPVFTTATFLGYLMAGLPGAIAATLGVFLPAVLLVGIAHPWLDRIRADASLSAAIEGLNAAAVGLIGFSVVLLAEEAFVPAGSIDLVAVGLALASFLILLSGRLGPVPLLLAGAIIGLVVELWRA